MTGSIITGVLDWARCRNCQFYVRHDSDMGECHLTPFVVPKSTDDFCSFFQRSDAYREQLQQEQEE